MTAETLIDTYKIDPDNWQTFDKFELTQYILWEHPETGASITLLDFPKGSGIPTKHSHASNQFMYCLQGHYEYTDSGLELRPGSFYSNPKDHPHAPTIAHERSLLIEIYDGPHYYEMPDYHTQSTIGRIQPDKANDKNTYLVIATAAKLLPDEGDDQFQAHRDFLQSLDVKHSAGFNGVLCSDMDSCATGATYLLTATDAVEAESIVNSDPFSSLYANVKIQRIR